MEGLKKKIKEQDMIIEGLLLNAGSLDFTLVERLMSASYFDNPKIQQKVLYNIVNRNDTKTLQQILDDERYTPSDKFSDHVCLALRKCKKECIEVLFSNEKFLSSTENNWLEYFVNNYQIRTDIWAELKKCLKLMFEVALKRGWDLQFRHNELLRLAIRCQDTKFIGRVIDNLPSYPVMCVSHTDSSDIFESYLKICVGPICLFGDSPHTVDHLSSFLPIFLALLKFPELDVMKTISIDLLLVFCYIENYKAVEKLLEHPRFVASETNLSLTVTNTEICNLLCGHSVQGNYHPYPKSLWKWTKKNWKYCPRPKREKYQQLLLCVQHLFGTTRMIKDLHEMLLGELMPEYKK